jgi:hypothetical protein
LTIGYEQALPDAVLGELKRSRVDLVVDTRAVAASIRSGASTTSISRRRTRKTRSTN